MRCSNVVGGFSTGVASDLEPSEVLVDSLSVGVIKTHLFNCSAPPNIDIGMNEDLSFLNEPLVQLGIQRSRLVPILSCRS